MQEGNIPEEEYDFGESCTIGKRLGLRERRGIVSQKKENLVH